MAAKRKIVLDQMAAMFCFVLFVLFCFPGGVFRVYFFGCVFPGGAFRVYFFGCVFPGGVFRVYFSGVFFRVDYPGGVIRVDFWVHYPGGLSGWTIRVDAWGI